jgi:hypothetical protein
MFLSLFVSLNFSSFLCPHKFDNLCWGLIQISTIIKATTICFANITNVCHYGVQTCLGCMLSPNISSHFIHLFGHLFVLSWSIYSDRAEKEWNINTT